MIKYNILKAVGLGLTLIGLFIAMGAACFLILSRVTDLF